MEGQKNEKEDHRNPSRTSGPGRQPYGYSLDPGRCQCRLFQNYKFGAEARINLFDWVSLAVPGTFTLDFTQFNLQPSVNLNLPLGFLDIALGVGTNMEIAYDNNEWKMNGEPFSEAGNAFLDSNFLYRGALTFNLGFLGIGLAAAVPSSGTFSGMGELDAWTPQWENTTLSASVLVNFF